MEYKSLFDNCIKCGKCTPTCTINLINRDEATSPRGFIDLLGAYDRGELELDRDTKDIFESCFLCTNCTFVCPNDLPVDLVIEQIRSEIATKFGIAWFKRAFFMLLRHRMLMDVLFRVGYIFIPCGFKRVESSGSIVSRLNLPIIKNRALPPLFFRSFLNSYKDSYSYKDSPKKVAIFIGCLSNYNYRGVGDSLMEILKRLEIDTLVPKKQLCCGAPPYFTGDFETVWYLIEKNLTYFESFIDSVDAIIVPEATCSAMIKEDWERYILYIKESNPKQKDELLRRVHKVSEKIFLATKWLYENTKLLEILDSEGKKVDEDVTYHDPCHARKVQGVFKEPRELLGESYNLVEMSDPNRCCGFGGVTMQSEKYHYAKAAGVEKANMIRDTKATIVSAECSACRIQLSDALYQGGVEASFAHPLELIARALRE